VSGSLEQSVRRVMSGEARGPGPALLRGVLRAAEPIYALTATLRNRRFDRGVGVARLPHPVISVGNLTAGGTGKTPLVLWLCPRLRQSGLRPAVLLRGYKSAPGSPSDEQLLLERELNAPGAEPIVVHAQADRLQGGQCVLRDHPDVDLFVLDDAFQHRQLWRNFDLVLIDACNPFGYGHVHPRGLLREPLRGLARADAVLLTRAAEVDEPQRQSIIAQIRRFAGSVPLYQADHVHTGLRSQKGEQPLTALAGLRYFSFCGIGNPESFGRQLAALPGQRVGHRWFADHHAYSDADLADLKRQARAAGADLLLTTEKDWVKIAARMTGDSAPEIRRLALTLRFHDDGQTQLLSQICDRVAKAAPINPS
jgi:tetraacyldisaccharide 4'-kinase